MGFVVPGSESIPVWREPVDHLLHRKGKGRHERILPNKFLCIHELAMQEDPESIVFGISGNRFALVNEGESGKSISDALQDASDSAAAPDAAIKSGGGA